MIVMYIMYGHCSYGVRTNIKYMANLKSIRKIITSGNSRAVTLPIDFLQKLKWKEKQKISIELDLANKRLVIRDWKK